ncbi:MAG: hypothetical protein SLAVMIC_01051 [uncultured marine phage]|uniref:Uncharacterized protein n=1 Tax=uncultured marine phage TaxID=707152 RepID=A0A8D9FRL5_9VIRU|nr:MAG: hypothetical protein SLAVMIC_01051 [uncultured marine phage]
MDLTTLTYDLRIEAGYDAAGREYAYEGDYDYIDTGN